MANQNPKTDHLKPVYKNWEHTPTKAVRIPEIFLEEIEQHARIRDRNESGFELIINLLDTLTKDEISQLKLAVDAIADSSNIEDQPDLNEEISLTEQEKATFISKFGFIPSHFQLKIIDWILRGNGNGCCNAVAGAGKSTTLRIVAKALEESGYRPCDIKVCVFGKANSLDLISKFGDRWKNSISTLNSAGWRLLVKYLQINSSQRGLLKDYKYKIICQELNLIIGRNSKRSLLKDREIIENTGDFLKLIDLIRLCDVKVTTENIIGLSKHFQIERVYKPQDVAFWVRECLNVGEQQAINKQCFDFVDQVWLPVHWNLGAERWFKPYKFVLVDECQDLNEAQKKLVQILAGKNGRILAVGDPNQAVMGFAGADDNSYYNIVKSIDATELPLSICYRCPTSHINLVKELYPDIPIQAMSNAETGVIKQIENDSIYRYIQDNDLIIGRKTAPLVSLCIRLISRGKKAIVKGKKIGETLTKEVDEFTKIPGFYWRLFNDCLEQYRQIKINQYQGLDNEDELIEIINDKLDAIQTIYESNPQCQNEEELKSEIIKLFSDDNAPITLSTCHRAKGLEANRIFIWHPEHMPLIWKNQRNWQLQQEENIHYVALTRSKSELFICGKCDWYESEIESEIETEDIELDENEKTKKEDYFSINAKAAEQLIKDLKVWFPNEEQLNQLFNRLSSDPYYLEEIEANGKMIYNSVASKNGIRSAVQRYLLEFERALEIDREEELSHQADRPHPLDPDYF